jgi:RNase P subunit RPR2
METTCKKCGAIQEPNVKAVTFKNGVMHIEARCPDCDSFIKYLPQDTQIDPLSPMPFGKYKGRSIISIAHEDKGYAKWCAENLENKKYREAFKDALVSLI